MALSDVAVLAKSSPDYFGAGKWSGNSPRVNSSAKK